MSFKVAVITSSDSGYAGQREDKSGPVIVNFVKEAGFEVVHTILLPDDKEILKAEMARICDENIADLILTTGGTGFSPRDVMPEATKEIAHKDVPGIPEAMRYFSLQITGRAMLSRAAAAIREKTLIVNMPGSPKAVTECLEYILPHLTHGLEILTERTSNCARK
ncbi:MAG: MogA/MoaB family molybdenum cofactor biosynthesis protein [Oscillospiraceae bacterium]|nr:MogA/MoaB family molybdenum cofactor biosynthesis protein [Oscillospiraceae bacterium]